MCVVPLLGARAGANAVAPKWSIKNSEIRKPQFAKTRANAVAPKWGIEQLKKSREINVMQPISQISNKNTWCSIENWWRQNKTTKQDNDITHNENKMQNDITGTRVRPDGWISGRKDNKFARRNMKHTFCFVLPCCQWAGQLGWFAPRPPMGWLMSVRLWNSGACLLLCLLRIC